MISVVYEKTGLGQLTNEALIGVSASRIGITLLTVNSRDFAMVTEFCPLKWELLEFDTDRNDFYPADRRRRLDK